MNIFRNENNPNKNNDSDKLSDIEVVDFRAELNTSLNLENLIFAKFSNSEIKDMLEESKVFEKITERGYNNFKLIIEPISDLDNRIFIKTDMDEVLIHIRLKIADFNIKVIQENRKMIFIDWLLTQNIKLGKLKEKKILFQGQEYPGLNIFKELTYFIILLFSKMNCYGIINIPEYFHDAVLFQKSFKFIDPIKQGHFESILKSFKKHTIRGISNLIHFGHFAFLDTNQVYKWEHGEMLFTNDEYLSDTILIRSIMKKLNTQKQISFF